MKTNQHVQVQVCNVRKPTVTEPTDGHDFLPQ